MRGITIRIGYDADIAKLNDRSGHAMMRILEVKSAVSALVTRVGSIAQSVGVHDRRIADILNWDVESRIKALEEANARLSRENETMARLLQGLEGSIERRFYAQSQSVAILRNETTTDIANAIAEAFTAYTAALNNPAERIARLEAEQSDRDNDMESLESRYTSLFDAIREAANNQSYSASQFTNAITHLADRIARLETEMGEDIGHESSDKSPQS